MFIVVVFASSMFLAVSAFVVGTTSMQQFHRANSEYHQNNLAVIGQAIASTASERPINVYKNGFVYLDNPNSPIDLNKPQWRYLHFREPLSLNYKSESAQFQTESSSFRIMPKPIHKIIEDRIAIWMDSPTGGFRSKAEYLLENPCSDEVKSISAPTWCGANNSLWVNVESGTYSHSLIEGEQQRLFRLSRKFYRFYADARSFDGIVSVGTQGKPLTHILESFSAGVTVTASTCKGIHTTVTSHPIYLNCNDLFNAWGEPIYVHVPNRGNRMLLTNVLGLKYLNGSTVEHVRMAEEINIELK